MLLLSPRQVLLAVFLFFSVAPVIVEAWYPSYDTMRSGMLAGLWDYFDKENPFWIKVTWWGFFVHDTNNSVRQGRRVCESCFTAKQDPGQNCGDSVQYLVDALITIAVTLTAGYRHNWGWTRTAKVASIDPATKSLLVEFNENK